jgi:hypothetical protein
MSVEMSAARFGATFLAQNVDGINSVWNRIYSVISGWGTGCTAIIDDISPVTLSHRRQCAAVPGLSHHDRKLVKQ